jgi:hypothetical protein
VAGACANRGSRARFAPIARSSNATATVASTTCATIIAGQLPRISIFARCASAQFCWRRQLRNRQNFLGRGSAQRRSRQACAPSFAFDLGHERKIGDFSDLDAISARLFGDVQGAISTFDEAAVRAVLCRFAA